MKYTLLLLLSSILFLSGCNMQSSTTPNQSPNILSTSLNILHNELYVASLPTMVSYYKDFVGLDVITVTDDRAELGFSGKTFLTLLQNPQAAASNPRDAGLYHIAYLFTDRKDLASRVQRIIQYKPESFEGSSDHTVSEAFYFHDPENNGIELYFDRDPSSRTWNSGMVTMGGKYIDPMAYIQQHLGSGTTNDFHIGHNHLKVGDIAQAKTFYHDILGFDITSDMSAQGALFVSVGGYHHHFGLNVRNSRGASKRPFPQLGLGTMTLKLASAQDLEKLAERLTNNSIIFKKNSKTGTITLQDPWGNTLQFTY